MVLKFLKPKITQSVFIMGVRFDSKKVLNIIEPIITFIIVAKNTKPFIINTRNKNKNKKRINS